MRHWTLGRLPLALQEVQRRDLTWSDRLFVAIFHPTSWWQHDPQKKLCDQSLRIEEFPEAFFLDFLCKSQLKHLEDLEKYRCDVMEEKAQTSVSARKRRFFSS